MRHFQLAIGLTASFLASAGLLQSQQPQGSPPVADKQSHETKIHGYTLADDYFWLRQKTNPAVRSYLEAENAYTAAVMKPTEALQKTLYDELVGHIKETDLSVPYRRGPYMYYSKVAAGKQYPVYVRKPVSGGAEQVLLDQNELAKGLGYYAINEQVAPKLNGIRAVFHRPHPRPETDRNAVHDVREFLEKAGIEP